jgi:MFS-type transporter involved in bile tolerance (Atg22 family)
MNEMIQPLSRRGIARYSVASFGGGFFYAFNNFILPLILPSNNVLLVNLLSNTRSIEGAVIQPVVGAWSDRIWTRLGRRRPFMLIAIPLSALFMSITPLASSLGWIVVCIFLFSLLFNVAADPYQALQGDIAPPSQRPTLNAVATVVGYVGQIALGLFIAFGPFGKHIPPIVYPLTAAGILAAFLFTVATVPERREQVHLEPRHGLGEYVRSLRAHHQAMRYLLAMFCYSVGINTIQVNLTRYATHVLRVSDGDAILLAMILLLITMLCTVPAAWLARRAGLKTVIMGGMALIALAASGALLAGTLGQVMPLMVVAGAGNGCLSLTWPLLTLLVPQERLGVFAGLSSSAGSISAVFSGFVAAAFVDAWGYRSIFTVLLVAIVCCLVLFSTIRVPAQRQQETGLPVLAT